jgi:hypothetical protein
MEPNLPSLPAFFEEWKITFTWPLEFSDPEILLHFSKADMGLNLPSNDQSKEN